MCFIWRWQTKIKKICLRWSDCKDPVTFIEIKSASYMYWFVISLNNFRDTYRILSYIHAKNVRSAGSKCAWRFRLNGIFQADAIQAFNGVSKDTRPKTGAAILPLNLLLDLGQGCRIYKSRWDEQVSIVWALYDLPRGRSCSKLQL